MTPAWAQIGYLAAAVCFIVALKGLSSPRTARQGNLVGAAGAVLATVLVFVAGELRGAAAQPAAPSPAPSGKNSTDGEFSALAAASRVENSTSGELSPSGAADPSTGSGRRHE